MTRGTNNYHRIAARVLLFGMMVSPLYAQTRDAKTLALQQQKETQQFNSQQSAGSLTGQRMTAYLQNIRAAFDHALGIAEGERQRILTQLAKDIQTVQSETISLGRTKTMSDLKGRVDGLKQYWLGKENLMKQYIGLILSGRIRNTIERFRSVETKIDTLIGRLPDTASLDELKALDKTFGETAF